MVKQLEAKLHHYEQLDNVVYDNSSQPNGEYYVTPGRGGRQGDGGESHHAVPAKGECKTFLDPPSSQGSNYHAARYPSGMSHVRSSSHEPLQHLSRPPPRDKPSYSKYLSDIEALQHTINNILSEARRPYQLSSNGATLIVNRLEDASRSVYDLHESFFRYLYSVGSRDEANAALVNKKELIEKISATIVDIESESSAAAQKQVLLLPRCALSGYQRKPQALVGHLPTLESWGLAFHVVLPAVKNAVSIQMVGMKLTGQT